MTQELHPDFRTNLPDTEYFIFGTGKYTAAIQWSQAEGASPFGFTIWEPQHLPRKWVTYFYHPEYGFERTQLRVIIDGVTYQPQRKHLKVEPIFTNGKAQFVVT